MLPQNKFALGENSHRTLLIIKIKLKKLIDYNDTKSIRRENDNEKITYG